MGLKGQGDPEAGPPGPVDWRCPSLSRCLCSLDCGAKKEFLREIDQKNPKGDGWTMQGRAFHKLRESESFFPQWVFYEA